MILCPKLTGAGTSHNIASPPTVCILCCRPVLSYYRGKGFLGRCELLSGSGQLSGANQRLMAGPSRCSEVPSTWEGRGLHRRLPV